MSCDPDESQEPKVLQEISKRRREVLAALQQQRWTGRRNVYTCPAGHELATVDVDEGVTPMLVKCRTAGCDELARSAFYRVDQTVAPTHEFYRPNGSETNRLDRDTRYHVEQGGLLLREIARTADPTAHPTLAGARRVVLKGRRAIKIAASLGEKSTAAAVQLARERRAAKDRAAKKRRAKRSIEKATRKAGRR